jgi:hypothetical protein
MNTTIAGPANGQFLRYAQLVVSNESIGFDLSELRFRFEVKASDTESPNTAAIRIYNPKASTSNDLWNSGTYVTLSAGYVNGIRGTVFEGQVKQIRIGREKNVDSYLDIFAADGDVAYTQSIINKSFPAGTTDSQQLSELAKSMGIPVDQNADGFLTTGGILPRGKTMFGMARIHMADLAKNNDCRWSIQNGVLTLVPNTGYLPGDIVAITSASGMIGTPEQTDNGILVRCYLNPAIKIGRRVQINNADINKTNVVQNFFYPKYGSQYYPATVTNDGVYRVLVIEHVGDTRGNDFYTELTCLDIDSSSPAATSVLAAG